MTRKTRKTVTEETVKIIQNMVAQENVKIKDISKAVSLHPKTVSNIIKRTSKAEAFIPAGEKRKETCRLRNMVFSNVEQVINNTLVCNSSFVQKEIQEKILETQQVLISQPTISRKIKKMKFTRKRLCLVPEERNTSERLNARAIYSGEISRISDANLIFLDETGFNQHTRRSYGYSLQNTPAYITVPANKGVNRSLICAIGITGVVAYKYKTGAFNAISFGQFITEQLVPYFIRNPNKILIMDNVMFHKTNEIQRILRQNNIPFKYLVPYSPELNPIEEFFSMVKAQFKSIKNERPALPIVDALDEILRVESGYANECINFYRNMRSWLEKARRKELFI